MQPIEFLFYLSVGFCTSLALARILSCAGLSCV